MLDRRGFLRFAGIVTAAFTLARTTGEIPVPSTVYLGSFGAVLSVGGHGSDVSSPGHG